MDLGSWRESRIIFYKENKYFDHSLIWTSCTSVADVKMIQLGW